MVTKPPSLQVPCAWVAYFYRNIEHILSNLIIKNVIYFQYPPTSQGCGGSVQWGGTPSLLLASLRSSRPEVAGDIWKMS